MIVQEDINRKVLKDYFFVKGTLDIDCNYFIEKIKKGCDSESNTGLQSLMTPRHFFKEDKYFNQIIKQLIDWIDENYNFMPYQLAGAWGVEVRHNEKTIFHDHREYLWTGLIYLNPSSQKLLFPEIKREVTPDKGVFCLFSPFLLHGCENNKDKDSKFGIAFDMESI